MSCDSPHKHNDDPTLRIIDRLQKQETKAEVGDFTRPVRANQVEYLLFRRSRAANLRHEPEQRARSGMRRLSICG